MLSKEFVAIFLLVIISSVGALTPEAQSNPEQQTNEVVSAISLLFEETLNNLYQTLVVVPKEETGLMFDSEEGEEEEGSEGSEGSEGEEGEEGEEGSEGSEGSKGNKPKPKPNHKPTPKPKPHHKSNETNEKFTKCFQLIQESVENKGTPAVPKKCAKVYASYKFCIEDIGKYSGSHRPPGTAPSLKHDEKVKRMDCYKMELAMGWVTKE